MFWFPLSFQFEFDIYHSPPQLTPTPNEIRCLFP